MVEICACVCDERNEKAREAVVVGDDRRKKHKKFLASKCIFVARTLGLTHKATHTARAS